MLRHLVTMAQGQGVSSSKREGECEIPSSSRSGKRLSGRAAGSCSIPSRSSSRRRGGGVVVVPGSPFEEVDELQR
jgi:hypothetical protein